MKQQMLEAKLQRVEAILRKALIDPNPKADIADALRVIQSQ